MIPFIGIFCSVLSLAAGNLPELPAGPPPAVSAAASIVAEADAVHAECKLEGILDPVVFRRAYASLGAAQRSGTILAVADMSRPSTEQRLHIIDLASRRSVLRTWVAHGKNSGELYCERTSNRVGSLQTSKGLYRVGEEIVSPKHGAALLLHGLSKGINDKALTREIILHSADYVSQEFIDENGRLGRSYGCPAVPRDRIDEVIALLSKGAYLYVYAR